MKIAFSLSGQPYSFPECLSTFLDNIYSSIECNTFCHFWYDESYLNRCYKMHYNMKLEQNNISQKFQSIFTTFEKNHSYDLSFTERFDTNTWQNMSLNYHRMMTPIFLYGYLSQTESINKSCYNISNDYDIIIKSRPDLIYTKNIGQIISQLDFTEDTIYFQDSMQGGHLYAGEFSHNICDWFYVGRSDIIKHFTFQLHNQVPHKFRNGIKHMRDYNNQLCEENNIKVQLVDFGALIHKQTPLFDTKYKNNISLYLNDFDFDKSYPRTPEIWPYWIEYVDFVHFKNLT